MFGVDEAIPAAWPPPSGVFSPLAAGLHEGGEEAPARLVRGIKCLRVILYGQDEGIFWRLDSLDDIVLGPGDDLDACSRLFHRLMVKAVDPRPQDPDGRGELGAGAHAERVADSGAWLRCVVVAGDARI